MKPLRNSISLFFSLLIHLIGLLILWAIIGENPYGREPQGFIVDFVESQRSKVSRKPLHRDIVRKKLELNQGIIKTPERRQTTKIKVDLPQLRFDLDAAGLKGDLDEPAYSLADYTDDRNQSENSRMPVGLGNRGRPTVDGSNLGKIDGISLGGVGSPKPEFSGTMIKLADHLISRNKTGKADLIFLVDSSGTMRPYILKVARELSALAKRIRDADIDLLIGIVAFNRLNREDRFDVVDVTPDIDLIKRKLIAIRCVGDERALDALAETLTIMKVRNDADHMIVLVTDEKMKGSVSIDGIQSLAKTRQFRVYIMGVDDENQKKLASETDGLWFELPSSEEELAIW